MLGTCLEAALLYSLEDSGGTLGAEGECSTVHEERRNSLKGFCRTQITKHIFELLLRYYPLAEAERLILWDGEVAIGTFTQAASVLVY